MLEGRGVAKVQQAAPEPSGVLALGPPGLT